jgi:hypothetical protein
VRVAWPRYPGFCRQAAACFEAACRISLRDDRERVLQMAEQLLSLAEKAEAEERC